MKILGCDYDGTLNYDGIDQAKLDAIQRWRDAGNKLGIVSGRGPTLMSAVEKEFHLALDFLVAFNGGIILDSNQKEIFRARCTSVHLTALVQDLLDWNCPFVHVNSDKYYLIQPEGATLREGGLFLKDVSLPNLLHQVSVELPDTQTAANIIPLIEAKYGEALTPLLNQRCIDIVPKGVGKAQGIYKIAEFYGVEWKDIITVGDNFNDIDMLKEFHSYAMENGVDEVKAIAERSTKSVTELIDKELKNK